MSSPSPESIEFTKLFLFGTVAAVDYLSPEIIRPENATTPKDYDVNIYMAGPGRFATVDKFLVTQLFFSSADAPPSKADGYTKQEMFAYYQIPQDDSLFQGDPFGSNPRALFLNQTLYGVFDSDYIDSTVGRKSETYSAV